jgi:hypothetical protein
MLSASQDINTISSFHLYSWQLTLALSLSTIDPRASLTFCSYQHGCCQQWPLLAVVLPSPSPCCRLSFFRSFGVLVPLESPGLHTNNYVNRWLIGASRRKIQVAAFCCWACLLSKIDCVGTLPLYPLLWGKEYLPSCCWLRVNIDGFEAETSEEVWLPFKTVQPWATLSTLYVKEDNNILLKNIIKMS